MTQKEIKEQMKHLKNRINVLRFKDPDRDLKREKLGQELKRLRSLLKVK